MPYRTLKTTSGTECIETTGSTASSLRIKPIHPSGGLLWFDRQHGFSRSHGLGAILVGRSSSHYLLTYDLYAVMFAQEGLAQEGLVNVLFGAWFPGSAIQHRSADRLSFHPGW